MAYNAHRQDEATLRGDKRALKVELKEMELSHEDIVKNLQLEYDKRISALRDDMQQSAKVRDPPP